MNTIFDPLFACGAAYARLTGQPVTEAMEKMMEVEAQRRATTSASQAFIAVVLVGAAVAFAVMARRVPRFGWKLLATAAGVLIFEFFTAPMWRNEKLGWWGYVYHDVSWVLTVGWTALILGSITLVDAAVPFWGALPRFLLTLAVLLVLVLVAENVVVAIGIRDYAPEVKAVLSGVKIGNVPIEALYYVPVFTALVVAFAKYWSFAIDDPALVPTNRTAWLRALGLTVLAVVMFEVLVEPLVENKGYPAWSYFYRDLSVIGTGGWVLMIAAAAVVVYRFMRDWPLPHRFAAALVIITVLALPLESWLIHNGYRVYGPSATANFCGIKTWLTGVPIEVVFAIPMYMSLVIAFVRYWEIVGDNRL